MAAEDRHEEVFTDEECIDCTEQERSFDALTRGLANGSISRRKALRMLGAALVGSALASIPGVALAKPPPGKCKPHGDKCIVNRDCCSQNCFTQKGKMICGPVSGACFNNNDCTSFPGQDQCTKAVCNQAGVCVLEPIAGCCLNANQCPTPNDQCLKATCDNNVCGFESDVGKSCNDNNPCTENDKCNAAGLCAGTQITGCVGCSTDRECSEVMVTQCHEAFCNPTGVCQVRVTAGVPCDDDLPCTEGDTCTAEGFCVGTPRTCPPSNNPCVARTECDTTTGNCVEVPGNAGTQCREAAGPCDVAEVCTGTSAECPEDEFRPSSFICRPSAGPCDVAETCTGNSAECPPDRFEPPTTVCRPSAGPCDVEETCTGISAECPPDQLRPSGFVCRPSAGPCDVAETCTGTSAQCPPNTFKPNGTPCDRDNNLCTQDTCQNGTCQAGSPKTCPTGQTCVPVTGNCVCTVGITCGNTCCTGNNQICCPPGTTNAGTCKKEDACNK